MGRPFLGIGGGGDDVIRQIGAMMEGEEAMRLGKLAL